MDRSNTMVVSNGRKINFLMVVTCILVGITVIALAAAILALVVKLDKRIPDQVKQDIRDTAFTKTAAPATMNLLLTETSTHVSRHTKDLRTYDFIIVGCGTSGSVLASRLSENPKFSVACIEKGPHDLPSSSAWNGMSIPSNFNFISPHDPIIITTRQQLRNKPIYIPTSSGLGGTSRIYGMINVRPSPDSLADWPNGWHYDDLLPFYKKLEDHYCYHDDMDISQDACQAHHGRDGPLEVNGLDTSAFHRISKAFGVICNDTNQPWKGYVTDYNGNITNQPHSCSLFQQYKYRVNATFFQRGSSKTGYLTPSVLERPNLSVILDSTVTRIVFDDTAKAIGIEYFDPISHTIKQITALKEIILSAGAFATPHLLQVSGVGDPHHLKRINVPLIAENVHVGRNLNDHLSIPYIVQLKHCDELPNVNNGPFSWLIQFNSGIRNTTSNNIRDIQIYMMDTSDGTMTYSSRFCASQSTRNCNTNSTTRSTFRIILQQNDFRKGTVTALTNSIFDKPAVDLGWTQISDTDKRIIGHAVEILRSHVNNKSTEFGQAIAQEIVPGPMTLDEYLQQHVESALHPASTCQLGLCTDENLVVRGTKSLRVCDASSFGSQIDANPSATIFAMAEMLSDKLATIYHDHASPGVWTSRGTLLKFESRDLVPSPKTAAFELNETLVTFNPMNISEWNILNKFILPRLEALHKQGYKIVVFTNQFTLCRMGEKSNSLSLVQEDWKKTIEGIAHVLKVPLQVFTATCNDAFAKPQIRMWDDFVWLFNEGVPINFRASFFVGRYIENRFADEMNRQFAANIPLRYYTAQDQFSGISETMVMRHFEISQTVEINAPANSVWKLISSFFHIHKWHPQVIATDFNNEGSSIRRRVIFEGEMVDTIEQLEDFDDRRRQYSYKNVGGNWGNRVQKYQSTISVLESNNGKSSLVQWIGSFFSDHDMVTDFYRVGLNALAAYFSPPLPCVGGNYFLNKTLLIQQGRPNLAVYWRQEYHLNASELWKRVGIWKGKLNNEFSTKPGSEYSFKLPDPTPRIYETLISYDESNYELIYCMRPTIPRSLPVTSYVSMKKVVPTGPNTSAWIRTGQMIVDDGTSVDDAANQVLMNVFVAGGERLQQQILNLTRVSSL